MFGIDWRLYEDNHGSRFRRKELWQRPGNQSLQLPPEGGRNIWTSWRQRCRQDNLDEADSGPAKDGQRQNIHTGKCGKPQSGVLMSDWKHDRESCFLRAPERRRALDHASKLYGRTCQSAGSTGACRP